MPCPIQRHILRNRRPSTTACRAQLAGRWVYYGTETVYSEVKRRFLPFLNCLKCQSWPFFAILLTDMQRMLLFMKDFIGNSVDPRKDLFEVPNSGWFGEIAYLNFIR